MNEYEVIKDTTIPDTWRVEMTKNTGEVLVTIFSGPHAEVEAKEYAYFRNNSTW